MGSRNAAYRGPQPRESTATDFHVLELRACFFTARCSFYKYLGTTFIFIRNRIKIRIKHNNFICSTTNELCTSLPAFSLKSCSGCDVLVMEGGVEWRLLGRVRDRVDYSNGSNIFYVSWMWNQLLNQGDYSYDFSVILLQLVFLWLFFWKLFVSHVTPEYILGFKRKFREIRQQMQCFNNRRIKMIWVIKMLQLHLQFICWTLHWHILVDAVYNFVHFCSVRVYVWLFGWNVLDGWYWSLSKDRCGFIIDFSYKYLPNNKEDRNIEFPH